MARPDPLANRKGLMGRGTCFQFSLFGSACQLPLYNQSLQPAIPQLFETGGIARRPIRILEGTFRTISATRLQKSCSKKICAPMKSVTGALLRVRSL
jgi:hypothetical protein